MLRKDDLLRVAREDQAFFSNEKKVSRERWVIDRWLHARAVIGARVTVGADPPDFVIDDRDVEIVELQQPGRRRGDQYRAKVKAAEKGLSFGRQMASRKRVSERGHDWVVDAILEKSKKYEPHASAAWTLLMYVNVPFAECLSWLNVEARLEELQPAFAEIAVVFETGPGPVARTIWRRID